MTARAIFLPFAQLVSALRARMSIGGVFRNALSCRRKYSSGLMRK